MRWLSIAALTLGCTSTVSDDYALGEERLVVWSEGRFLPDAERVAEVVAEADLQVDGPPRINIEIDPDSCFPSYSATGFPAIDLEAGRVVVPLAFSLQMSNHPGELELVWFDMATGEELRRDVLLDEEYEMPELEEDARVVLEDEPETLFFGEGGRGVVDFDGERAIRSGGNACGENDPRLCHIAHERAVSNRVLTARLPHDYQ